MIVSSQSRTTILSVSEKRKHNFLDKTLGDLRDISQCGVEIRSGVIRFVHFFISNRLIYVRIQILGNIFASAVNVSIVSTIFANTCGTWYYSTSPQFSNGDHFNLFVHSLIIDKLL